MAQTKQKVDFPNVAPPSLMERNLSKTPTSLRVCGNTIPVINGKAGESDPKKLRAIRMREKRKLGLGADEDRI